MIENEIKNKTCKNANAQLNSNDVIFVINQYASDLTSGFGGRSYSFSYELSKSFENVALICAEDHHLSFRGEDKRTNDEDIKSSFKIIKLRLLRNARSRGLYRILNWFIFAIRIFFIRKKTDLNPTVIIYSSPSLIGFLGAFLLAKRVKAKLILDVRDIWPLSLIQVGGMSKYNPAIIAFSLIEKFAYAKSDSIISPLEGLGHHISEKLGYDHKSILYIPTPYLEIEKFLEGEETETERQIISIAKEKFIIGYCGTFGPSNCLDNLVLTAELLKNNTDLHFILVGDGWYEKVIRQLVTKFNLTNVTILSKVPKSRVGKVIENFDLGYLGWKNLDLYRYGTGPNKISEYLRFGVPIIHAYSGAYDLIRTHGLGKSAPAGSPCQLADAALKLKHLDKKEMADLKIRCKKYAKEAFVAGQCCRPLIDLIKSS